MGIVDGQLIASQPIVSYREGRYAQVPMIIGSNAREGSLFVSGETAFENAAQLSAALVRTYIDVSPEAYQRLDSGEYPRTMQWQLTKCADTGPMLFEFQTGANAWWTSLWIRNARLPIMRAEVKSANHAAFVALQRAGDGTLTDAQGFGEGAFQLRLTALDGQIYEESLAWPAGGIAGQLLTGHGNFQ